MSKGAIAGLSRYFTLVFFSFLYLSLTPFDSFANTLPCDSLLSKSEHKTLFKIEFDENQHPKFSGLTNDGIELLKNERDKLRERKKLFQITFKNLNSTYHALHTARLYQGHMFLYGPPGGAKSKLVDWLINADQTPSFKRLMNPMITEQELIGGHDFEAIKEGRFELNIAAGAANYPLVSLDEIDKANPAVLASILRLMNEREIIAGGVTHKAKTESLFATSNANLPEFLKQFEETGSNSTGLALLNRFHFKVFNYNWLDLLDQIKLDELNQKNRIIKAITKSNPELIDKLKNDTNFNNPRPIDWESLREISQVLFEPSTLFLISLREMTESLRQQLLQSARTSAENHQSDPMLEPFIYVPTAEFTERLRQQVPEVIMMSAFLDFLESPLANDETIEALTKKTIPLDFTSIWRSYLIFTTISPGKTELNFNPTEQNMLDINFKWNKGLILPRDRREELMIQNIKEEQKIFKETLSKILNKNHAAIENTSKSFLSGKNQELKNTKNFEIMLLQANRTE